MASQSYPSPNAAQIAGGAGPFYQQNGLSPTADIPNDLSLAAELSRAAQPAMTPGNGVQDNSMGTSQHLQTPLRQPTSQEQLAQGVMSLQAHTDPYGTPPQPPDVQDPSSNQRKRSKVSRACDECRRKKIRCDATSENGPEACSSCKRTGARCQFSRQPMKRGPSKGYIKELADRIHSLEATLGPQGLPTRPQDQQQQQQSDMYLQNLSDQSITALQDYSPPHGSQYARKRTHSVSEGLHDPYAVPQRTGWSPQDSQRQLPYAGVSQAPSSDMKPAQFSQNGGMQSNWPRRESIGAYDQEAAAAAVFLEWDESVADEYYRLIHPDLPFLPNNKDRLGQRLGNCPPTLREAFLLALDCAVRSFPTSNLPHDSGKSQNATKAAQLLAAYQSESAALAIKSVDLIYIQTLILLAIESNNQGPAMYGGQAKPRNAQWLGQAIAAANDLKLDTVIHIEWLRDGNSDVDEKLGRRVYWVLFILDQWRAMSTAQKPLISLDKGTVLLSEDRDILGESAYHLVSLSFIIGRLVVFFITANAPSADPAASLSPLLTPNNPFLHVAVSAIEGELDRFRDFSTNTIGSVHLIHLAYWHTRLLVTRLIPSSTAYDVLPLATRMANSLNTMATPTVFNYHFAALAALTLDELLEVNETRDEALRSLDELEQALNRIVKPDSSSWDAVIRDIVARKKTQALSGSADTMMRLEHLANAAMGERGSAEDRPGSAGDGASAAQAAAAAAQATAAAAQLQMGNSFDPTALIKYGYLNVLAQEIR